MVNRTENSIKNRFVSLTKAIIKRKPKNFALNKKSNIQAIRQLINKIKLNLQENDKKEENLPCFNLIEENKNKINEFPEFIKENSQPIDNSFFANINLNKMNKQYLNNFTQERENSPSSDYQKNPNNTYSEFTQSLNRDYSPPLMDFSSFLKKYVNSQTPYLETEFKNIKKELLEFSKNPAKWLDSDDSILSEEDFFVKKKGNSE